MIMEVEGKELILALVITAVLVGAGFLAKALFF
jgi:hypothetical protein